MKAPIDPHLPRSMNAILAKATLIAVLSTCAMLHVWRDMWSIGFRDEESTHITIVPVVFLWLLWIRRNRFPKLDGKNASVGMLIVLGAMLMHEIGLATSTVVLWHASAPLLLVGGLCLALGTRFLREFVAPIVILAFVVPIPGLLRQQISLPIQWLSAITTGWTLSHCGFEIERFGCVLSVNGTKVMVAEACNGMRMLFSVFLVVFTLAFSVVTTKRRKLTILLAAPLIAAMLNTVRLIVTTAAYGLADEWLATAVHDGLGWFIPLAIMVGAIAVVGDRWNIDVGDHLANRLLPWHQTTSLSYGYLILLVAVGVANSYRPPNPQRIEQHHRNVRLAVESLPYAIGDWVSIDGTIHDEEIRMLKPMVSFRRHYRNLESEQEITLLAVASRHARDLIGHEPGICFVGQGWTVTKQQPLQWRVDQQIIHGREYQFTATGAAKHVASILMTADGKTSGDARLVADAASDFRLEPFGAAMIQILADSNYESTEWQKITTEFVQAFRPTFHSYHIAAK